MTVAQRISLLPTFACKFFIFTIFRPLSSKMALADTALEAHAQKLLRLHGKLHRQFAKDLLTEAVDDHRYRILRRNAALPAVKKLILADLRGRGLVLHLRQVVHYLKIRKGMGATLIAQKQ